MNNAKHNQTALIKADLLAGKPVNSIAMFPLNITRLSSIIYRLRKYGWPIHTVKKDGNGIADYSLPKGRHPQTQKSPGTS